MSNQLKKNLSRFETWQRLLYIVLFVFVYSVAELVVVAVVAVQFGFVLITGNCNQNLLDFGAALSRFLYDVLLYFTFKSDRKPFPFDAWPKAG